MMMILADCLQALTIKIGTIAPLRSPWVKELKKLGVEWKKITNGKVTLKIYAGGIAGGEDDMVRKIRLGTLGGAIFTNIGINSIYPDSNVLNIPFLFNSEKELDYILEKMRPTFEGEIEKKGFKVIAYTKAGWIYFFTKKPVTYPEDLRKHKLSFSTGARIWEEAWKKSGYQMIPGELKDLMMALQSGMVNAFYLHPLIAASGQYFPLAPNMLTLKIAPLVGGVVFSERVWKRVPDQYKEEILAVVHSMIDRLYQETIELEREAIQEMKKHGLVINSVPPDALEKWRAVSDKGLDVLLGKAFSNDIYDKVIQHLKKFRKKESEALTIKIGTIVPLRSPWVKELKKLGLEWKKITNGKVTIKIFAGGIVGGDDDMVRKIRMNILGGAVFTNVGINNIYPDSNVLNIPFLFKSVEELDYILDKMKPGFEQEIEKKGFKVIAYTKAGWVYFFSKNPVVYPGDLKKHKLSISHGARVWEEAWKKSGYRVIPGTLKDLMMSLQGGIVNSFYMHPLVAASGQYFPLAPNMCPLKILPVVGGIVFSNQKWECISDKYKEKMLAVVQKMIDRLYQETNKLEKEAIQEMKKHGLVINPVPPDALEKWKAVSDKGLDVLLGRAFSKKVYSQVIQHLNDFRKQDTGY
jgi:TRAP-type C4-dicarboxylate transport system substrate-binding protein